MESTAYFIAGSIFLVLTMIWAFVKWRLKRNEAHEKAKKDVDAAIDSGDFNGLDDARQRMRETR